MDNYIENFKEHKYKIIAVVIVLFLSLFLIVKAINKPNETNDANQYKQHLVISNDSSERYKFNLLAYLDSIGTRLIDCDEDVAKRLREFASNFREESKNLNSFVYIGNEVVEGSELYFDLSNLYLEMATNLDEIATAIDNQDKDNVVHYFELLQENLVEIEDKN